MENLQIQRDYGDMTAYLQCMGLSEKMKRKSLKQLEKLKY